MRKREATFLESEDDPFWFKDGVIYELHVRAFRDSNGDGIGDFRGLIEKIDYLQDLGVTAVWLLPFCPSPLRDDGYDIADYTGIHGAYGSLRDFRTFLRHAHRRGLRVITELVVNHTSDQHPWFQRARRSKPGSKWRDFYVWHDRADRYKETRIIFKDFEPSNWTWDPVAQSYYWHRFYSHQPDLNYDSPHVQRAIFGALDFWLGMGVDGLRLDAVPYLYEREGTNCENLPETYEFLRKLRSHVDGRHANRMLLAEANQWPEDAVAYFGAGDLCHMTFHFPLMPRLFMALRMEDRFPVIDIMEQTPLIPESCQWGLFLRNHDELTLEMVTDEERDYMYRVYAQDPQMRINLGIRRRLAPLLGNNRRRTELMNGLLFSMPGTPIIYYGDEIGMGDHIYLGDRNAVRTPMQWSGDRNAGFSKTNPQRLYLPVNIDPEYHYETVNVEAQQNNPSSLLWWMKRLIALRKTYKAFGRGTFEFLHPENRKILTFLREYESEHILVIANLSRFVQCAELDLHRFKGMVPIELFGRTEFPPIGELPYFLTLGPHSFYWFVIEPPRAMETTVHVQPSEIRLPTLEGRSHWDLVFKGKNARRLEGILTAYMKNRRWFGGKARTLRAATILETIPIPNTVPTAFFILVKIDYVEGDPETYLMPVAYTDAEEAEHILDENSPSVITRVTNPEDSRQGIIYDATVNRCICEAILELFSRRRRLKGLKGTLLTTPTKVYHQIRKASESPLDPADIALLKGEQSNTSVIFKARYILKLFRRLEGGTNPDLEIGRFLTEKEFPHVPPVAGALEYQQQGPPMTVGVLHGLVMNQGDAWAYTQDVLAHYLEQVLARGTEREDPAIPQEHLLDLAEMEISPVASEAIGAYAESARLLGHRTAELHMALASGADNPDFSPEPFSKLYQRSLYQSMRSLSSRVFQLFRQRLPQIPETERTEAERILTLEGRILASFGSILQLKISALRIRCHGDYHLGQVLYTGKDFVIIDFEGEPAHPLSERRIKRSPLRDVSGMLRSFHYATYAALFAQRSAGLIREDEFVHVEPWLQFWYRWVSAIFLKAYGEVLRGEDVLPREPDELKALLDVYLLEKAIYELGYELNNRPEWTRIPLQGIRDLVEGQG